jgi:signal transduction histidine kinase
VTASIPLVDVQETHPVGRFTTALLLSGILLAVALTIAWNTAAGAALPFLVYYSLASVWLAAGLCAGSDEYLWLVAALAAALFSAPLGHLALVFPRQWEGVAGVRGLPGVYYASGGLFCGLTVLGFHGSAEIWLLMERLIPAFALLAWCAILISSVAVLHGQSSRLERARARVVLVGSAWMAALVLGVGTLAGAHSGFAHRIGAVVLLPIPIATALVRYHVFDLHPRLRRISPAFVYSSLAGGVLTLLAVLMDRAGHAELPLDDIGLLYTWLVVLLLAGEPLREWLLGRARELVSRAARRRRNAAVRCIQQLAELRDPDACARIVAETLVTSLRASWVVVFLRSPELGLRPSHAIGSGAPLSLELARRADSLALAGEVVHLPRASADEASAALLRSGVEVVMPLRSAAGISGLVLLGEREEPVPYSLEDLEHLAALGAQAGVALENARLARELVDAERTAAQGNLAVGLAHELGKPLRVIEDIARSLQEGGPAEPARTRRELAAIAEISRELIRSVYGFVHEARRRRVRPGRSVADVVARALHSLRHLHGEDRVSVSLAPDLPDVIGGDELVTVLSNLLDNALLASRAGDSVRLLATSDEHEVRLEVVDDGHGMDARTAARAFDLFFTTRGAQGGSGVGLALCREIVGHLGGSIDLRSQPGKGTQATVRLPRLA